MRAIVALVLLSFACGHKQSVATDLGAPITFRVDRPNKVDILFLLDNSPSTNPRKVMVSAVPKFIDQLDALATSGDKAWYHIGAVTSDLGAGPKSLGNGACVPGGQGGKLQTLPAPNAGQANCHPPGNNLATGMSANFIDYNQLTGESNAPDGQTIKNTFTCLSASGGQGCGFEHVLEAIYQALKQPNPDTASANAGFLRDDAMLVVVLATDEDDCSAPPDTDLFDPASTQYGVANSSFRCTQFGLTIDGKNPLSGPIPTLRRSGGSTMFSATSICSPSPKRKAA